MKKFLTIFTSVAIAIAGIGVTAYAQQGEGMEKTGSSSTTVEKMQSPEETDAPSEGTATPQTEKAQQGSKQPQLTAEVLEGASVYGKKDEKVAEIEKIVSEANRDPDYAVLKVGSIFGFGGRSVRVPLNAIKVDQSGKLIVAATEDELSQFPPYAAESE